MVVRPFLYARRAVQATSNFSPESSRSIGQNGVPGLGTCTKSNLLELIERDERVNIVPHVAVLNFQGTGEQGTLIQPSPDDRVVKLLPARTLDDEPDGDVITGPGKTNSCSKRAKITEPPAFALPEVKVPIFKPNSTVQDNVDIGKVCGSPGGRENRLCRNCLEVLQLFPRSLARRGRTQ